MELDARVVHRILGTLDQYGALHVRELARISRTSTKTLCRYLPILERRGLVRTVVERKWKIVMITEEGSDYLRRLEQAVALLA